MVERLGDVPAGVIGLRASGKLTRDDYRNVMEPALKEATDSGEARVLFVLPSFDGLEPGAILEDMKTGLGALFAHRSDWKRLALVTDVDWVARAMRMFEWAMPGELMVAGMDELERAKAWLSG
jgi:stage II sporulation SpoAA-like protein